MFVAFRLIPVTKNVLFFYIGDLMPFLNALFIQAFTIEKRFHGNLRKKKGNGMGIAFLHLRCGLTA